MARFSESLMGVRYGEPFVVKETLRIDNMVALGARCKGDGVESW